MNKIINIITASIDVKKEMLASPTIIDKIASAITLVTDTLKTNNKIMLCGNGGSACDASHIAAEFSGRFYKNRPAMRAIDLHSNIAHLTAVSNDFGYDHVFARMLQAIGQKNDVLIAISTSGNSLNIIEAIHQAKAMDIKVIGLTGHQGGKMMDLCDLLINIPSNDTPRIQEAHIMVGHILCEEVENSLYGHL